MAILGDEHRATELLVGNLIGEQAIDLRDNQGALRSGSGSCRQDGRLPRPARSRVTSNRLTVDTRSQQSAAPGCEEEHRDQEQAGRYQHAGDYDGTSRTPTW